MTKERIQILLLVALLLGWVLTVYQRSPAWPPQPGTPSNPYLSERLSLAAKYCDPLAPPVKSLLLRLALMSQDDPSTRSVILGRPVSPESQTSLSPRFRLMAQYQTHPDPALEQRLRVLSSSSLVRLNGALFAQFLVFLIALACFLFGSLPPPGLSGAQTPIAAHHAATIIGVYCAWDTLSFFLARQLAHASGLVGSAYAVLNLSSALSYLPLAVFLVWSVRRSGWRPGGIGGWGWVGPAYALCFIGIHAIEFLLGELFGIAMPENPYLLRLVGQASPLQGLNLIMVIVFLGPFFEELVFRGWLLGGLVPHWGQTKSLLFSALIFAASHGISAQFPALLLLGWVLGWVYLRTSSLGACFAVHALWNATALISIFAQAPF